VWIFIAVAGVKIAQKVDSEYHDQQFNYRLYK
jgi:hypothetical protein